MSAADDDAAKFDDASPYRVVMGLVTDFHTDLGGLFL
jgi:hypothetical protein